MPACRLLLCLRAGSISTCALPVAACATDAGSADSGALPPLLRLRDQRVFLCHAKCCKSSSWLAVVGARLADLCAVGRLLAPSVRGAAACCNDNARGWSNANLGQPACIHDVRAFLGYNAASTALGRPTLNAAQRKASYACARCV